MAAEIQAIAVCQMCGERGQSAKDYWYQANKKSGKDEKGKNDKKGQRKSTRTKDFNNKRKGACNSCKVVGHFASNCPRRKKREPHNASYGGGDDLHCLTYTDDQFQSILMRGKVRLEAEQSNITELLMDYGAANHVRSCRVTAGNSCDAFLNVTDTQTTSQGMLEAKSQLIEESGEKVTVKVMFELVSMRCPILSVGRLERKEFVVVMENERRYKSYKKNREIPLHKYNGVYHVHESELLESCPLEDPSNVDEPPAVTVIETTMPWTRGLSHKYTENERMLQSVCVTAIPDLSMSVFVWARSIRILDSWDYREVMIKCDQEQSLMSLAELFREQRRPRSRMVENTHCDMEGLARTRRSDPIERTGTSVDVKLLLTS